MGSEEESKRELSPWVVRLVQEVPGVGHPSASVLALRPDKPLLSLGDRRRAASASMNEGQGARERKDLRLFWPTPLHRKLQKPAPCRRAEPGPWRDTPRAGLRAWRLHRVLLKLTSSPSSRNSSDGPEERHVPWEATRQCRQRGRTRRDEAPSASVRKLNARSAMVLTRV